MDIQFDNEVKRARFPLLAWLTSRQAFWVLLAVCVACIFLSFLSADETNGGFPKRLGEQIGRAHV